MQQLLEGHNIVVMDTKSRFLRTGHGFLGYSNLLHYSYRKRMIKNKGKNVELIYCDGQQVAKRKNIFPV